MKAFKTKAFKTKLLKKNPWSSNDDIAVGTKPRNKLTSNDDIMFRSTSKTVKCAMNIVEIMDHQMMLRSETEKIIGEGISSCQLTRTYGLVVYALKDLGINICLVNPQHIEMLQRIMKLIYPDQNLFGVPGKDLTYTPDVSNALKYLQDALTFSSVSDVKCPNFIRVNKDDPPYASNFNNGYFNKIRTFAIIKDMIPDGEYPIHYFNVVMSEELNEICCYSSWGATSRAASIRVPLRRFPITYDLLTNMKDLIAQMIDTNLTSTPATLTGYESVEQYKDTLGPIEKLYIVELLGPDNGPLVDTVAHVLRHVNPPLAAEGAGGSIKNKKRTRKQSIKRTKRSRGRTNKRTTRRTKKTYKKR